MPFKNIVLSAILHSLIILAIYNFGLNLGVIKSQEDILVSVISYHVQPQKNEIDTKDYKLAQANERPEIKDTVNKVDDTKEVIKKPRPKKTAEKKDPPLDLKKEVAVKGSQIKEEEEVKKEQKKKNLDLPKKEAMKKDEVKIEPKKELVKEEEIKLEPKEGSGPELAKIEQDSELEEVKQEESEPVNIEPSFTELSDLDLSEREKFNISTQIRRCFQKALIKEGADSLVQISIDLTIDANGFVSIDEDKNSIKEKSESIVRIIKSTVRYCNLIRNLPIDKFKIWNEIRINFKNENPANSG